MRVNVRSVTTSDERTPGKGLDSVFLRLVTRRRREVVADGVAFAAQSQSGESGEV
jgi:hypothetical protein